MDGETLALKVSRWFFSRYTVATFKMCCLDLHSSVLPAEASRRSLGGCFIPWHCDIWLHMFSLLFLLVWKVSSTVTLDVSTKTKRCVRITPLKRPLFSGQACNHLRDVLFLFTMPLLHVSMFFQVSCPQLTPFPSPKDVAAQSCLEVLVMVSQSEARVGVPEKCQPFQK